MHPNEEALRKAGVRYRGHIVSPPDRPNIVCRATTRWTFLDGKWVIGHEPEIDSIDTTGMDSRFLPYLLEVEGPVYDRSEPPPPLKFYAEKFQACLDELARLRAESESAVR